MTKNKTAGKTAKVKVDFCGVQIELTQGELEELWRRDARGEFN